MAENLILLFCILFFVGILDFALMNLCGFCDLNYFECLNNLWTTPCCEVEVDGLRIIFVEKSDLNENSS